MSARRLSVIVGPKYTGLMMPRERLVSPTVGMIRYKLA